jgi:hypothetical protein
MAGGGTLRTLGAHHLLELQLLYIKPPLDVDPPDEGPLIANFECLGDHFGQPSAGAGCTFGSVLGDSAVQRHACSPLTAVLNK